MSKFFATGASDSESESSEEEVQAPAFGKQQAYAVSSLIELIFETIIKRTPFTF